MKGNEYEIELVTKLQDSLLELAKIYPTFYHCELIHGGRSVEVLEEQMICRDERHDKKNEYVDFEVVDQVFFIDADMVMERKER